METALDEKQTGGVPILAVAKVGPNWGKMKPLTH